MYTFDSNVYEKKFTEPVDKIKPLVSVNTGGMTALYDGVGTCAERLKKLQKKNDPTTAFCVMVVTDGEENYSSRFDAEMLRKLMAETQGTDKWTYAFSVPNNSYKAALVSRLGIPAGNVTVWDTTSVSGHKNMAATNIGATNSYYVTRSLGATQSTSFYTDLSNVTSKDLKKDLVDVSDEFRAFRVHEEQDIKSLVEDRTKKPYVLGSTFYELTKPEAIQAHKDILIVAKKNKKPVYGGADARDVLGLPSTGTVKVKPGNHGDWNVFVQSTSTNRKLVRGTEVLVHK
jgi:hypothetical protein